MSPPIRDGSGDSIGSIRLGDGSEISEVRTGAGDVLFSGVFDPVLGESTLLAYGSDDNNVYVHDVGGSFPLNSTLSQSGGRVESGVSFSPDNSLIAYGEGFGGNNNVYVHDVGGGFALNSTLSQAGDLIRGVSFSPDNSLIAYGGDDQNVYVHDVGGSFPLNSTLSQAGGGIRSGVSFSPDNSLIAYGDDNGDIFVHDVGGSFPLNSTLTDPGGFVRTVDFSAGNNFLMVSEGFTGSDEIYIYDVPSLSLNTSFSAATDTILSRGSFNSV